MFSEFFVSLVAVAFLGIAGANAGEDWPQFRGAKGDGHSDSTGIALKWSESENVKWKVAIPGEGWSSPVILGGQVWMQTALDNGRSLRAGCVDRASGKLVHNTEIFYVDRKSTRLNSSHSQQSRMPSSA